MPFSLFGPQQPASFDFTAYNDPGPSPHASGLTLADLWQPAPQPEFPQPPEPITAASQLDEERKRQLRQQVLLQAAQAIGAGSANGQIGSYLAQAAQGVEDYRGQLVANAQAEAQQRYGAERVQAEAAFRQQQAAQQEEQGRRKAEAMLGMVQRIGSEDPTLGEQAAAAAREGRTDDLRKMLADLPRRAQMRQYGFDPDDPFADETMKSLISRRGRVETEQELRALDLGSYFRHPEESPEEAARRAGAIAEAQAAAYARHRASGGSDDGLKPRWMETGDMWGVGQMGPDGKPVFTPAEGMEPRPRYEFIRDPNPYDGDDSGWANPYDPSAPLIPVNRQVAGPKPAAPAAPQGQKARPDKQRLADIESVVGKLPAAARQQVLADLKAGKRPRDIVAQIKAARGQR